MMTAMAALAAWVVLNTAGPPLVPPPTYVTEPPDVLLVEVTGLPEARPPVKGEYLVRPDGTVSLGEYGGVAVAGLTLERAGNAIAARLKPFAKKDASLTVTVAVTACNSKAY